MLTLDESKTGLPNQAPKSHTKASPSCRITFALLVNLALFLVACSPPPLVRSDPNRVPRLLTPTPIPDDARLGWLAYVLDGDIWIKILPDGQHMLFARKATYPPSVAGPAVEFCRKES